MKALHEASSMNPLVARAIPLKKEKFIAATTIPSRINSPTSTTLLNRSATQNTMINNNYRDYYAAAEN